MTPSHPLDPERLIDRLVHDLEPVRPPWSLRRAFAIWAGLSLAAGAGVRLLAGVAPARLLVDTGAPLFVALLGVASLSAGLASLAAARPGRERLLRGALLLSVLAALAAALRVAFEWGPTALASLEPALHRRCMVYTLVFSLLPLAVATRLTLRGWVTRPHQAAAAVVLSAFSLGAVVSQWACGDPTAAHIAQGHLLPAVVVGALAAVACAYRLAARAAVRADWETS